jgi:hypothetical protein
MAIQHEGNAAGVQRRVAESVRLWRARRPYAEFFGPASLADPLDVDRDELRCEGRRSGVHVDVVAKGAQSLARAAVPGREFVWQGPSDDLPEGADTHVVDLEARLDYRVP